VSSKSVIMISDEPRLVPSDIVHYAVLVVKNGFRKIKNDDDYYYY